MSQAALSSQIQAIVEDTPSDSKSLIQQAFLLVSEEDLKNAGVRLSSEQRKLYYDIRKCRTYQCGFNVDVCDNCGNKRIHYNSCCNRNCPICNSLNKEYWIDERKSEVIDAPYYHAVLTCPHELNSLFMANEKVLFSLLHHSAGKAIVELAEDPEYLGATPGVLQVLHTWSQEMNFHPHIHAVISGGGLTKDRKLKTLKSGDFFIAESVLAALFKGKFLAELQTLYTSDKLRFTGDDTKLKDPILWAQFRDRLYNAKWVAKVKSTFNGNGNALEYLGRYIFKVAISDSRIRYVDKDSVIFSARGEDGKQSRSVTLSTVEFVRRFLLHVLPRGFQKVRYFGFLNNRSRKENLALIFNLQGFRLFTAKLKDKEIADIIFEKWSIDICLCPHCHARQFSRIYSFRGNYVPRN